MKTYTAQMQNETGTLVVGSGTITAKLALAITQEEAEYLRTNYAGIQIIETDTPDPES